MISPRSSCFRFLLFQALRGLESLTDRLMNGLLNRPRHYCLLRVQISIVVVFCWIKIWQGTKTQIPIKTNRSDPIQNSIIYFGMNFCWSFCRCCFCYKSGAAAGALRGTKTRLLGNAENDPNQREDFKTNCYDLDRSQIGKPLPNR